MRILRESMRRRNAMLLCDNSTESLCLPTESLRDGTGRMSVLQHLIPLALVFEHDFPEETNGRHAVAEQFVMEFLQRELVALLCLIVVEQFQDLQFAQGVIQITRIKRRAHGFLARRLL